MKQKLFPERTKLEKTDPEKMEKQKRLQPSQPQKFLIIKGLGEGVLG